MYNAYAGIIMNTKIGANINSTIAASMLMMVCNFIIYNLVVNVLKNSISTLLVYISI